MKYYKLTDKNNQTRNGTTWGVGVTHKASGQGKELCTEDVIHVYDHPLKAVIFNSQHANFGEGCKLWECKIKRVVANDKTRVGVKQCTTTKQIEVPEITINQRVRFAIYCALEVYKDANFIKWADGWLSGKDRTAEAAEAAARTAGTAEEATRAAAWAAVAAAWTTRVAAEAAARVAAEAAARAAARAAAIDFVALLRKAIKEE